MVIIDPAWNPSVDAQVDRSGVKEVILIGLIFRLSTGHIALAKTKM